jgi:hypothetical protein
MQPRSTLTARASFEACFRANLAQYVEYSLDANSRRLGTMIFGEESLWNSLAQFSGPLGFAGEWLVAARRFAAAVKPVNYLLKVDWQDWQVLSLSLYYRFMDNLSAEDLADAFARATPFSWEGPAPQEIGRVLGAARPHGVGLRVQADGTYHAAVYNRVSMPSMAFRLKSLPELIELCRMPASLEQEISTDMALVYRQGPVGVVGVDGGTGNRAGAIKLDADGVPVSWAFRFISERGATVERVTQLSDMAVRLGLDRLGYLGLKYVADGFESWKFYIARQFRLMRPALAPHLDVNKWALPQ